MCSWVQSDLASWLAVIIMVVATALAWRALRPASYIEFLKDWQVELKGDVITVIGKIILITPSAYINVRGSSLKLNKNIVHLHLKSANSHMVEKDTKVLILEGKYIGGDLPESPIVILRLRVQLSDRKTKQFKTHVKLAKETIS